MFIFTRTLVTYARTIFMPRCCLNFQSMRTQAESTYIAHNMFGQIKMEIPWYINRHTLISRKRDGKPKMIGGQFVVVRALSFNIIQKLTNLLVQLSIFMIDLFVGTYRLSMNRCNSTGFGQPSSFSIVCLIPIVTFCGG